MEGAARPSSPDRAKGPARHGGREIDNAGDGFFCSFEDQADAIRCACEISEQVKELGIDVRAGLHVGQTEIVGRKLRGTTVNVAARVTAEAGAGDVLVSGVLRDLVAGSGFTFEDRGSKPLKGVPGDWRLVAVTAVDGSRRPPPLESDVATERRLTIEPPPLLQRRRWRLAALASAAIVIAGLLIAVLAQDESPPPPIEIPPDSLVRIDPESARVIGRSRSRIPSGRSWRL